MTKSLRIFGYPIFWLLIIVLCAQTPSVAAAPLDLPCENPGWFPEDFGVKDHSIFWYDGYYYATGNYLPYEKKFAYARSLDLCTWEVLDPILDERIPGTWDELAVWAPYVYVEDGIYYLYYAGVTKVFTQSILLATSTDPANPESWVREELLFQPNHTDSKWNDTGWADCRDPMVIKINGVYHLYYTAADEEGGIIGLATAATPRGEWTDWGKIIPPIPTTMPESPTLYKHDHFYYLFYHPSGQGEVYRIGASPTGPWLEPESLIPGWAHEVWEAQDGITYTSYLTSYAITISPLSWNPYSYPPQPFIGTQIYRIVLPIIFQ